MQTNIELAKPRDFGEIISDTFTFIKQNFKPLLKYFFMLCGFFVLAIAVITVLVQMKTLSFTNNISADGFDEQSAFSRAAAIWEGVGVLFFFMMLGYIAVAVMVLCYMVLYKKNHNTVPTSEEMWGYFKHYYLRIFGVSIVLTVLTVAGFFFCLIPGIYLSVVFALVAPIMIIENTSFGYAFNQSFKLIKDNWWVTFGVFVVVYIILYVVDLTISLPATVLGAGSVLFHIKEAKALTLPLAIFSAVIETVKYIFQIIIVVASGLVYFNLTESKEGIGLIERINEFGTNNAAPDATPEEY